MRFFGRFTEQTQPLASSEAFAQFYESTHLDTYRYVMALCGGRESQAEDVTADAYLRAWKSRKSFSGSSEAAFGWLLTIARRLLIDEYRAESSRPLEAEISDDVLDDAPDAEALLLTREMTGQVIADLQYIPEKQREMVVLRYVLGWRVNQIADYLAVPENTVSVSLHRSLKRLQEILSLQGVSNEG